MTALERLENLLDEKDRRIEEFEERVQALTEESESTWDWARHRLLEDDSALPVPRLEIRCRNLGDWYNWEWRYGIVYQHLTGTVVFVPLGHTKVGGDGRPPIRGDGSIRPPFSGRRAHLSRHETIGSARFRDSRRQDRAADA